MRFDVITIFPEMFRLVFSYGVISRGIKNGLVRLNVHNLRDYANSKHKTVDDKPFGGLKGMVLKPEPIYKAVEKIKEEDKNNQAYVVLTSPQGKRFNQNLARELYNKGWLIVICGRYEGIDERVLAIVDEEISIGDYILSGGEFAAMVLIDVISRLIPGVVKESECVESDTFSGKFLRPPVYTRPRVFRNMEVPKVLLSGNHKEIKEWMLRESIRNTLKKRPDLIDVDKLTPEERRVYNELTSPDGNKI